MNTSAIVETEPLFSGRVRLLLEDGSLVEAKASLGPGYWRRIRQRLLEEGYKPPMGSLPREESLPR